MKFVTEQRETKIKMPGRGRFGLCCMWDNDRTYPMRTVTLKAYRKAGSNGPNKLGEVALHNVRMSRQMIALCAVRGWNYRLSQTVLPLLAMPGLGIKPTDLPQWEQILNEFSGIAAERGSVRLSMHPSCFCIPGSANPRTVESALSELELSAFILDLCGAPRSYDAPINIHMGCSTDGLDNTIARFKAAISRASEAVGSRLVLENDDKGKWTTHIMYELGWTGPITFDFHHHFCNPGEHSEAQAFHLAMASWGGYRPLFHYSESDLANSNRRAHSEMPTRRANNFNALFDLDIELKGKSKAIEVYESLIENK
jgi:UV DNA damage endonuclease